MSKQIGYTIKALILILSTLSSHSSWATEGARQKLFSTEKPLEITIEAPFSGLDLHPGWEKASLVTN